MNTADTMKRIAVFCSASDHLDEKYTRAAREVVEGLCRKGYAIVSGGSFRGTMGVVSDTVKASGGYHIGVMPEFMQAFIYDGLNETVWTPTMALRKEAMRKDTDAVIALPGGTGTLDELFETHVLVKLGRYNGRIIVLNFNGFYEPLRALLDHYVREGMLTKTDRELIEFIDTPGQLLESF